MDKNMYSFIEVNNISFSYKKDKAIEDISLSIKNGEFTSLIGPNGSGKTTLGKIIMGILTPNEGKVYIDNIDITNKTLGEIGKSMGYLFQNPARQIFATKVKDELAFAMKFNKVSQEIIDSKSSYVVKMFDLEKLLDSNCYSLSQGEKQRLALATILLNEPKYLILDEPTTGLDNKRKEMLYEYFLKILREDIGILMISHDMDFVNKTSDRIIKIESGRLVDDRKN